MELTNSKNNSNKQLKLGLVWTNIILFSVLHLIALYGLFLIIKGYPNPYTILFAVFFGIQSQLGITAGAHRLWSHRSYKAKAPLRFLLVLMDTCVYQGSIITWCRDHRGHHKYTDSNADPHNVTRGFFFSHIGWTMMKKHPDVVEKGKGIDLSDLYNDPFVRFQHKYYFYLMPIASFVLPTVVPMYFWNETLISAYCVNIIRYLTIVHNTLTINSFAHRFGYRPYDRTIRPGDNVSLSIVTLGEGFHNYHHVFPWDYRSSEFGAFTFNITRAFIEFFAKIGWAYELKFPSEEMIKTRVNRTGDGNHGKWGWSNSFQEGQTKGEESAGIWGWGDKDQLKEDYKNVSIINKVNSI